MLSPTKHLQRCVGSVTAEFAIVLIILMMIVCGVIELARAMYMFNTLQMVTRRAATLAANADFSDPAAMADVRARAVFRNSPGGLTLGAPVTDAHVRIRYLSLGSTGGDDIAEIPTAGLPACPANNRITCMADPYSASCIRMVQVEICDPAEASECRGVSYQALFSSVGLSFALPKSTSIAAAETLGAPPGQAPCL